MHIALVLAIADDSHMPAGNVGSEKAFKRLDITVWLIRFNEYVLIIGGIPVLGHSR
ncbi:hypothetical protein D3C71_2089580 [compost metagenome]